MAKYVKSHFVARDASGHLKEEGFVIAGQHGTMITNPWHRIKRASMATIAILATRLKLCPIGYIRAKEAIRVN